MRVEPLRDAVAYRALRGRREARGAPRVGYLNGVVEDGEPRLHAREREVSVRERVGERFEERAAVVVCARLDGRVRVGARPPRARLVPEVAVALDETHARLEERVKVPEELNSLDPLGLRALARVARGGDGRARQ